jgi:drug/metabolite transporter (DMT)-like permease
MAEPAGAAAGDAGVALGVAETARESPGLGLAMALGATLCWSLAGILIRLIDEATSWHVILYRSLGVTATLGGILAVVHRG